MSWLVSYPSYMPHHQPHQERYNTTCLFRLLALLVQRPSLAVLRRFVAAAHFAIQFVLDIVPYSTSISDMLGINGMWYNDFIFQIKEGIYNGY